MKRINFHMALLATGVVAALGVLACGTISSLTNSKIDGSKGDIETGFDANGMAATCDALQHGYACSQLATAFSDACLDGGFEIKYCQGCKFLCSGKVSSNPNSSLCAAPKEWQVSLCVDAPLVSGKTFSRKNRSDETE